MSGLLVGVDLVDVREVEQALVTFKDRYLTRVFTRGEIAYALQSPAETARRLGARFAAKEAARKALRAGDGIGFRTIEVIKEEDGACDVGLTGAALAAANRAGVGSLTVSLSHEGDFAMAVVVGQRSSQDPPRVASMPDNTNVDPAEGAGVSTNAIRSILKEHARLAIDVDELKDDSDLYQAGMTSHASVNVMLALEGAFDTEFPDRMLRRGVFASVASIRSAVAELTRER